MATPKQTQMLLNLATLIDGGVYRYLDQILHLLPVSRAAVRSGLNNAEVSLCKEALEALFEARQAEAAAQPKPAGPEVCAVTPAELIGSLGRKVRVTWTSDNEEVVVAGELQQIDCAETDGTPRLNIWAAGRMRRPRVNMLTSWAVVVS